MLPSIWLRFDFEYCGCNEDDVDEDEHVFVRLFSNYKDIHIVWVPSGSSKNKQKTSKDFNKTINLQYSHTYPSIQLHSFLHPHLKRETLRSHKPNL